MKTINPTQSDYQNRINPLSAHCRRWSKYAAASLALLACVLCTLPLRAQTATFKSMQLRATVPLNYNSTILLITNILTVRTNGATIAPDGTGTNWLINPLNFAVSGAPAGVTAVVVDQTLTPVTTWTPHLNTNSTSTSSNLLVLLTFDGTETEGLSTMSLNVTGGVTDSIALQVQVGSFWTGDTNVTTSWSSPASWVSGVLPTNVDDVLFTQLGAQTNVNVGTNIVLNAAIFSNSVVDQNFTVASLRFMPTNSGVKYHTIQINPGVTLAVAGTNGFSMMKDYLNAFAPLAAGNGGITATFIGSGGRLVVTNEKASINLNVDSIANLLDLSGLGTFVSDVNQIGVGDTRLWPFFRSLQDQNAYGGQPRQSLTTFNLARTNIIKAVFADPNNYTNADSRFYSLSFLNSELTGSSTAPFINLGYTNSFFLDSVDFIGGNSRGTVQFNPSLVITTNLIVGVSTNYFTNNVFNAVFRGTNGGRMSVFTESDGGDTNTANSNVKATVDFTRGTLDLLCDRFYIARDRKLILSGQTPSYQGNFSMGSGIVDANTVVLGFREYNQTNTTPASGGFGSTEASVTVVSNGVFKVNQTLTLGSTVNTNAFALLYAANNTEFGQVTIVNGGTLIANTVLVGGPVYSASRNNFIIVSNAATFILSNTAASAAQSLDNLAIANASTLQVQIDGTHSGAYIFATNLTLSTTTSNNILKVASIKNISTFPATVPLIFHAAATAGSLPGVVFPSGFTGSLSDNGAGSTIDLLISTNAPKHLLWRGVDANWDLTSKNWLDQSTLLMTNFGNFDIVAFDDAAGYPTNIAIGDVVLPTAINMTNSALRYTFGSGGGQLSGSAVLTKSGTATLEVEIVSTIAYVINQGTLTNGAAGTLGGVTLAAGAVLANAGTINNGIDCSGLATISAGIVNGPLVVENGGVVTNLSLMQHGAFQVKGGGFLYNGLNADIQDYAASTVSSNATLINDGFLGDTFNVFSQTLAISGTFEDTGASGTPSMSVQTLTINPGALFIPGGDGIGSTFVRSPLGIATNPPPARVILSSGSTNIFKVDAGTMNNTVLYSGYQDFGPSQGSQLQNGCTLVITNVSATPFAAGQFFRLFQAFSGGNPLPTGTATNSFPIISPAKPGPGLIWDLTRLWGNDGSGNWGYIGVSKPGIVHLTNSFALSPDGTNIVGQFSWPSTNYGWRLQTLVTPRTVGLVASTNWNWGGVAGSWTNLSMTISNKISDDVTNTVFYRLVYP